MQKVLKIKKTIIVHFSGFYVSDCFLARSGEFLESLLVAQSNKIDSHSQITLHKTKNRCYHTSLFGVLCKD